MIVTEEQKTRWKNSGYLKENTNQLIQEKWPSNTVTNRSPTFSTQSEGNSYTSPKCCVNSALYSSRQIRLFPLENVSHGVVALSSKCYYCFGTDQKFSAKGVNRSLNQPTE